MHLHPETAEHAQNLDSHPKQENLKNTLRNLKNPSDNLKKTSGKPSEHLKKT